MKNERFILYLFASKIVILFGILIAFTTAPSFVFLVKENGALTSLFN